LYRDVLEGMARLILLDSGPLGLIVRAPSRPQIVRWRPATRVGQAQASNRRDIPLQAVSARYWSVA
jgi:hypothetical protein